MKNLVERMLVGIIAFEVVILSFNIAIDILKPKEKQYHYLTIENEWGFSSNCYLDENQNAVCFEEYELVRVRQFYEI